MTAHRDSQRATQACLEIAESFFPAAIGAYVNSVVE